MENIEEQDLIETYEQRNWCSIVPLHAFEWMSPVILYLVSPIRDVVSNIRSFFHILVIADKM